MYRMAANGPGMHQTTPTFRNGIHATGLRLGHGDSDTATRTRVHE